MDNKGNALFLILIAVALFAALSYAVTQSGRGGGSVDRETAALSASQAVQFVSSLEQAVTRMKITSGCADTDFNFDDAALTGYNNTTAPSDESCDLFSAAGGGLTYQSPPAGLNDGSEWVFTGMTNVLGVGTDGETDPATHELIAMLFNVTPEACREINSRVGLGNTIIIDRNAIDETPFVGTYTNVDSIAGPTASTTCSAQPLCGYYNACFQESNVGQRIVYYHVLLAR